MAAFANYPKSILRFIKKWIVVIFILGLLLFIQFGYPFIEPTMKIYINLGKIAFVRLRIEYERNANSGLTILFWLITILVVTDSLLWIVNKVNNKTNHYFKSNILDQGSLAIFSLVSLISADILLKLFLESFETYSKPSIISDFIVFTIIYGLWISRFFLFYVFIVSMFALIKIILQSRTIINLSFLDIHNVNRVSRSKLAFSGFIAFLGMNYHSGVLLDIFRTGGISVFVITKLPLTIDPENNLLFKVNSQWLLLTTIILGIIYSTIYFKDQYQSKNQTENDTLQDQEDKEENPYSIRGSSKAFLTFVIFMIWLQFILLKDSKSAIITFDIAGIVLSTLIWGTLFLSLAVGLNLTYKILGFPNFAHAEYLTIGGFVAIFMQSLPIFSNNPNSPGALREDVLFYALIAGFVISGSFAMLFDILLFKPLREKNSTPETMMIASLGLALFIRGLIFMRFSGSSLYFEPKEATEAAQHDIIKRRFQLLLGDKITDSVYLEPFNRRGSLQLFGVSSYIINMVVMLNLFIIILMIFIKFTRLGKAMRAVSDDPELAAASGINVEQIRLFSWFIGGGLAGVGGVFWSGLFAFTPITGSLFLLPAFAVIVLGTIGSIEGAIIAAFIIGFVRAMSGPILSGIAQPLNRIALATLDTIVPFVVLILVLLFNPEGIGKRLEEGRLEKARKKYKDIDEIEEVNQ